MLKNHEERVTIRKKSYEVRLQWFALLDRVRSHNIKLIVEDSGNDAVVVLSMEEYKRLAEYNDEIRKHII